MQKTDVYILIHKAQRKCLFEFSIKIGQADFADKAQALDIRENILFIIDLLHHHSELEETYIHPLYADFLHMPLIQKIIDEHEELESKLNLLREIVFSNKYDDLYMRYNQFLAMYLIHTDREEEAQSKVLWEQISDKDLSDALRKAKMSMSSDQVLKDFKWIFSALNIAEIIPMLTEIKTNAPEEFYQKTYEIAQSSFSDDKWAAIKYRLFSSAK